AGAVRMIKVEVQGHLPHLPYKPVPDKEPEIPAIEDKPEKWQAEECIPVTGRRETGPSRFMERVPRRNREAHVFVPDPMPGCKDESEKYQFESNRISKSHAGVDQTLEARAIFRSNNATLHKLLYH